MTKRRVPEITPEEEAQLARIIAEGDPDDIFPTDEELANARPFSEAHPELAASILRERPDLAEPMRRHAEAFHRRRGRPAVQSPKQQVSIRLDPDVLAKLKATGPGWQARVNDILRKAVG
jgi:uncharacterized protein (DUF4415 family)